ncbi:MAG: CpaF family protein [Lachnospiraceae bacterium]|nr:CpaF family protein [Lachnospiraceae bacterium]
MIRSDDKKQRIREELLAEMDFTRDFSDEELYSLIDEKIRRMAEEEYISLENRRRIRTDVFCGLRKLDILEELLRDKTVTEIMVNGTENIFIERGGGLEHWDNSFESEEKLENIVQQIVSKCNRVVNESSPIVDARLSDGSRVNVVLKPIALNGPILTIRKFPEKPFDMEGLIGVGALSEEMAAFLKKLVKAKYNILISGGTGSGKTTFLNALSGFIPKDQRVITIEDSAELQIQSVSNLVRLECRNANTEGCAEVNMRDLIRSALRMRPDRVVVGEVRGAEVIDMLQAMSTGHDGSLSTAHANTAADMLIRLETMYLMGLELPVAAIRQQILSAVDVIVHLGRLRDKSRKVLEIAELDGFEDGRIKLRTLYKFDYAKGRCEKLEDLKYVEKILAAGL